jgi:hypothetical protein
MRSEAVTKSRIFWLLSVNSWRCHPWPAVFFLSLTRDQIECYQISQRANGQSSEPLRTTQDGNCEGVFTLVTVIAPLAAPNNPVQPAPA